MSSRLDNLTISYENLQMILKLSKILINNKVLILENNQEIQMDKYIILIDFYLCALKADPDKSIIQKIESLLKELNKFCNIHILPVIYSAFEKVTK